MSVTIFWTPSDRPLFLLLSPTLLPRVPHILRRFLLLTFPPEVKDMCSTIKSLHFHHSSNLYSLRDPRDDKDKVILTV